jgi:hypothetical protein
MAFFGATNPYKINEGQQQQLLEDLMLYLL